MKKSVQKVDLLAVTPNALELIYSAFRQCYSSEYVGDLWDGYLSGDISKQSMVEFVSRILESGHESPIEHVNFTFSIDGVSRALTHQLVRHRLASYSQQSQRYVDADDFRYIVPPSIECDNEAVELYEKCMQDIAECYSRLKFLIGKNKKSSGIKEDARFVLPQATETKIVFTMNCRTLLNFFEIRCCRRAQWEIRKMAWAMLKLCQNEMPYVFGVAGPRCHRLGYCPELEKYSCGKFPSKKKGLGIDA